MTVRRDLEELSARNLLRKVHGGAVPVPKTAAEPHFVQKQALNRPEKETIARAAARLVEDGDTVAFSADDDLARGGGAAAGPRGPYVRNQLDQHRAHAPGGGVGEDTALRRQFPHPPDALVGPFADRTLRTLNADVLFLGAHGIHPVAGLTTPNTAEAETDRCLVEAAQRVVVVADHSKLGVVALAKIVPLDRVDVLVTDGGRLRRCCGRSGSPASAWWSPTRAGGLVGTLRPLGVRILRFWPSAGAGGFQTRPYGAGGVGGPLGFCLR